MTTIGRNDKCLCGSGLKYKKCCGDNVTIISQPTQHSDAYKKLHITYTKILQEQLGRFLIENYTEEQIYLGTDEFYEWDIENSEAEDKCRHSICEAWILQKWIPNFGRRKTNKLNILQQFVAENRNTFNAYGASGMRPEPWCKNLDVNREGESY